MPASAPLLRDAGSVPAQSGRARQGCLQARTRALASDAIAGIWAWTSGLRSPEECEVAVSAARPAAFGHGGRADGDRAPSTQRWHMDQRHADSGRSLCGLARGLRDSSDASPATATETRIKRLEETSGPSFPPSQPGSERARPATWFRCMKSPCYLRTLVPPPCPSDTLCGAVLCVSKAESTPPNHEEEIRTSGSGFKKMMPNLYISLPFTPPYSQTWPAARHAGRCSVRLAASCPRAAQRALLPRRRSQRSRQRLVPLPMGPVSPWAPVSILSL